MEKRIRTSETERDDQIGVALKNPSVWAAFDAAEDKEPWVHFNNFAATLSAELGYSPEEASMVFNRLRKILSNNGQA